MKDKEDDTVLEPHRRRRRIVMAVVLTPVLAAWFVWGPLGIISYVGGLFNSTWSYVVLFYLLWALPAAVLVLLVLVVYGALTWRRQSHGHRRTLSLALVALGGLVTPIALGYAGIAPSMHDMFVRGFAVHVRLRTDIGAIQAWLTTLDPKDFTDEHGHLRHRDISRSELPLCIARLKPKRAAILLDNEGRPRVRLQWGTGFIEPWGLVVGSRDMEIPKTREPYYGDPRSQRAGRFYERGEYRQPLGPGAYYWSVLE